MLLPTALQHLGYAEGQNLVIERRFAEGQRDRLPGLARELVELQMEAIVAISNEPIRAAKDATQTIPIVMLGGNVVREGFVASLARPGGNITGVVISETGLAPKRLHLLKEASISGLSRRMASYVDRILKGASPAELPVEQPSTYELVINLKTAKALGLTIPPPLLLRADEVLQ
jgi:ABC-type uncharacterized transport system substrate-binding protein